MDDHWEDFTNATQWEKLVQTLSEFSNKLASNNKDSTVAFNFEWKRTLFTVTFYSFSASFLPFPEHSHFIRSISNLAQYICIEVSEESSSSSALHLSCNEARLLLSAWLTASRHCVMNKFDAFCQFSSHNPTSNYIGYSLKSDAHYISHSFPYVPENVHSLDGILEWTSEKQNLLYGQLCPFTTNVTKFFQFEPCAEASLFILYEFDRIFGIGCHKKPIKKIEFEQFISKSNDPDILFMKIIIPKPKPKTYLFSNSLLIADSALKQQINLMETKKIVEEKVLDDFSNLYTFLFKGTSDIFCSRLVDCFVFVIQKDSMLLDLFWKGFISILKENTNNFDAFLTIEVSASNCVLSQTLETLKRYAKSLESKTAAMKSEKGKKQLIPDSAIYEPYTMDLCCSKNSMDQLRSDIQAFKAANSDAAFTDFISWHSPNDWNSDGTLSARMSCSTEWKDIWDTAEPKTICDQTEDSSFIFENLEGIKIDDLLLFMIPRCIQSFLNSISKTNLWSEYSLIQERTALLYSLFNNFCWTEYRSSPQVISLEEILDQIARLEQSIMAIDIIQKSVLNLNVEEIQSGLLENCTPVRVDIVCLEEKKEIIGIIGDKLEIYASIEKNSFEILEKSV